MPVVELLLITKLGGKYEQGTMVGIAAPGWDCVDEADMLSRTGTEKTHCDIVRANVKGHADEAKTRDSGFDYNWGRRDLQVHGVLVADMPQRELDNFIKRRRKVRMGAIPDRIKTPMLDPDVRVTLNRADVVTLVDTDFSDNSGYIDPEED